MIGLLNFVTDSPNVKMPLATKHWAAQFLNSEGNTWAKYRLELNSLISGVDG